MKYKAFRRSALAVLVLASLATSNVFANDYREEGKSTKIADSAMTVTPPRDWNKLGVRPGKFAETWTLDGEQLNDVTFYGGVEPGRPLVRERDKKLEPLPKFTDGMLLIEIPELVQGTYRAYKQISKFEVTNTTPGTFLGKDGVKFTYQYLDADELPRKGEARAVIIDKKLFMVTFDAPRLHYFDRAVDDFRALADTARLK
jgi:hypothetical protein